MWVGQYGNLAGPDIFSQLNQLACRQLQHVHPARDHRFCREMVECVYGYMRQSAKTHRISADVDGRLGDAD